MSSRDESIAEPWSKTARQPRSFSSSFCYDFSGLDEFMARCPGKEIQHFNSATQSPNKAAQAIQKADENQYDGGLAPAMRLVADVEVAAPNSSKS